MGFDLNILSGRLIAGQVFAPTRASEVARIQAEVSRLIGIVRAPIVMVADIRHLGTLDPAAQKAYQDMLIADNGVIEYSALWAEKSSAASLQFYRTVQEAKNPRRQVFLKPEDFEAWLKPKLTPPEFEALRIFVEVRSKKS